MHTLSINCQLHYRVINATQFIFQLQIAEHPWQTIVNESFQLKPDLTFEQYHRDNALNRLIRVYAPEGDLIVQYNAEVQTYIPERDTTLKECEIQDLPSDTLFYLAPSRFCESDLIGIMVNHTFGDLPKGYTRVQAICDWISAELRPELCRYRFGYMPFYEAQPDFHAIFEVYLENQWVLFDATRMGPIDQFVRIGTGLDAKDVPFATVYGEIELISMSPLIERVGA